MIERSSIGIMALTTAFALVGGRGTALAETTADLVAKAKQEKEVVYYTELIVDQIVRPLASAFEKKYGIKVVFWRGDSQQALLKLSMEHRAGRMMADVWSTASGLRSLIDGGLIASFTTENAAALPAEFRDRNGYWASTNMIVLGPAINTNLVAAGARPRSYEDLLNPKWRGKLVWKPNDVTGAWGFIGNVLTNMGEADGLAYLRRLNEQRIAPMGAATRAILDHVAVGEYSAILGVSNHNTEIARKAGAPVAWLPLDSAWATLHTIGVTAAARHPNAARLFVDFALSKEGQEIFQKAGYLPTHPDVPPTTAALRAREGGFKTNVFTPEEIDKNLSRWSDVFSAIFR
jgi:iron(III) transport system substrate-binding protein